MTFPETDEAPERLLKGKQFSLVCRTANKQVATVACDGNPFPKAKVLTHQRAFSHMCQMKEDSRLYDRIWIPRIRPLIQSDSVSYFLHSGLAWNPSFAQVTDRMVEHLRVNAAYLLSMCLDILAVSAEIPHWGLLASTATRTLELGGTEGLEQRK